MILEMTIKEINQSWLNSFVQRFFMETDFHISTMSYENEIRIDWITKEYDLSLEIDLYDKTAIWHGLNIKTGEEELNDLDLKEEEDWKWVVRRLKDWKRLLFLN